MLNQPSHPRESIDSVTTFFVSQGTVVDTDSINCWPKPLVMWLLRARDYNQVISVGRNRTYHISINCVLLAYYCTYFLVFAAIAVSQSQLGINYLVRD